jgi:hypothetical protein
MTMKSSASIVSLKLAAETLDRLGLVVHLLMLVLLKHLLLLGTARAIFLAVSWPKVVKELQLWDLPLHRQINKVHNIRCPNRDPRPPLLKHLLFRAGTILEVPAPTDMAVNRLRRLHLLVRVKAPV